MQDIMFFFYEVIVIYNVPHESMMICEIRFIVHFNQSEQNYLNI